LALAPALKNLSIEDNVVASLTAAAGTHNVPPLCSTSLEVLHFEITSSNSVSAASATASYYNYLASSLLSGGLPNLRAVYVRDPNFPDTLLGLPPPMPGFAEGVAARPASSGFDNALSPRMSSNGLPPGFSPYSPRMSVSPGQTPQQPYHNRFPSSGQQQNLLQPQPYGQQQQTQNQRFSSNNPFANHVSAEAPASIANLPALLEVFTKDGDELNWSFFGRVVEKRAKSPARPLSSYGLGNDVLGGSAVGWSAGAGARRSVLVGGAGGQFLQVPGGDEGGGLGGRQHRKGRSTGAGVGAAAPRSRLAGGADEGVEEWPRPNTSSGAKKSEAIDLWR